VTDVDARVNGAARIGIRHYIIGHTRIPERGCGQT